MRHPSLVALLVLSACAGLGAEEKKEPVPKPPVPNQVSDRPMTVIADRYQMTVEKIAERAKAESRAYERLRHLCDVIGHRLSGSTGMDNAVQWCAEVMREDGLDNVRTEKVMVPKWVRGKESARLIAPYEDDLVMLGLGLSVGTPPDGIEADVVAVGNFDELEALVADDPQAIEGKIVVYDYPMPPYDPEKGSGYGTTVQYRLHGASRAAKYGAVAILIRSVTANSLQTPHTGMLVYDAEQPKIPAAALTIEGASQIHRLHDAGVPVRIRLSMEARMEPDHRCANVVGELTGRVRPEEVVVIGGHLDSWDVGHGAHDDGGACVAVMEALRLIRSMGLRPRRTIRAVLFTNEENGLRGAHAYVGAHEDEMEGHVAAIESDSGVFRPIGFGSPKPKDDRGRRIRARLDEMASLLVPMGSNDLRDGGGGADIGPMGKLGVPLLGLRVEGSRYFDLHHTSADTFDKVDKEEFDLCVATLAAMAFMIADNPERLDAE